VVASLNHPHIAAIHGVEESEGVRGLVLELVEGETLAERVARAGRPGLRLQEALGYARQIADALEAAHEKGITHRDLKPANIKITADGVVKLLDFGIAKVVTGEGPGIDLTHAPPRRWTATQRRHDRRDAGYMSPEQARGKPVDKRTDIWAFGCVLYEMLSGRMAFAGDTLSDTIAAILERDPDWSRCRPTRREPSAACSSDASRRIPSSASGTSATRGSRSSRSSAGGTTTIDAGVAHSAVRCGAGARSRHGGGGVFAVAAAGLAGSR
jgi:serine/threonine protein kinase